MIHDMVAQAAQVPALIELLVGKGVFDADEWDGAIERTEARLRSSVGL